jgi:predicted dehydrogenase
MLRIGLLGASRIAPKAVIAPAMASPAFQVTAIAARDPERAKAYGAEHGIPGVARDYAELIARDDVDIVYNALPPAGHATWTIAALAAGKAVLCEKPFARDAGEAQAMVEAARRAGRPLLEAFHYRFHAVNRRAEALVASGALGRILRAKAVFEVAISREIDDLRWRADQAGGALMDLGCYPLHSLRTLLGEEPRVVSATGEFVEGVDAAITAQLAFPSGATASLACSMTPSAPRAMVRLEGEGGSLEIINFVAPQIGCRFVTSLDGVETVQPTDGPTTYEAQLEHLRAVMEDGATPLTGGGDAVANMAAIDAIYARAGR